jgi:hypothetical protein
VSARSSRQTRGLVHFARTTAPDTRHECKMYGCSTRVRARLPPDAPPCISRPLRPQTVGLDTRHECKMYGFQFVSARGSSRTCRLVHFAPNAALDTHDYKLYGFSTRVRNCFSRPPAAPGHRHHGNDQCSKVLARHALRQSGFARSGGECLTFEAVAGGRLGASWGRWGSVRGNGWCLLCLLVLLASLGAPICLYLAFDRTFVVLVVASILQSPPLG